jgi:2-oxoisovalerate dehydrogenase E1 component alpha subunit
LNETMSAIRTRLHVPRAPARPGEKSDFSYVQISPPGAAARPDPNAALAQTTYLADEMVRDKLGLVRPDEVIVPLD